MSDENEQTPWVPLVERIRYWWGHPTFNPAKEIQAAFEKHTASLRAECERLRGELSDIKQAHENRMIMIEGLCKTRDSLNNQLTAAKSQVETLTAALKTAIAHLMAQCGPLDSWKKNENPQLFNLIITLSNSLDGPFTTEDAIAFNPALASTKPPATEGK